MTRAGPHGRSGPTLGDLHRRSDALELPDGLCPPGLPPADVLVPEPLREAAFLLGCAPDARDRDGLVSRAGELLAERAREVYRLRLDCDVAAAGGAVACGSAGLSRASARSPARVPGWLVVPHEAQPAGSWVLLQPENVVARSCGRWRGLELAEEVERYVGGSVSTTWDAAARGALDGVHAPEVRPDPRPPGPVAALLEAWGWALTSPAAWAACPAGARLLLVGLSAGGAVAVQALSAADALGSRGLHLPAVRDDVLRYRLLEGLDVGPRAWAWAASLADAGAFPRDAGAGERGFAPGAPPDRSRRQRALVGRESEAEAWAAGGAP